MYEGAVGVPQALCFHYFSRPSEFSLTLPRFKASSDTFPIQLILPESFKLFPVYALSFNKTKAMKGGPVVSDVRTYYMRWIKSMGASDVMDLLYPKMMPIHTLSPDAMQPDEHGRVKLPRLMRCSYARMEPHGAYLIRK